MVLLLLFLLPAFEAVIVCAIPIGLYGVISDAWPAVMISATPHSQVRLERDEDKLPTC
jgi:hypothetical protein